MKRRIFHIGIFAVWAFCLISAPSLRLLVQEPEMSVVLNPAEEEAESSISLDSLEEAVSPDDTRMAFIRPQEAPARVPFASLPAIPEIIWEVCSPPPERVAFPSEISVAFKPFAGLA